MPDLKLTSVDGHVPQVVRKGNKTYVAPLCPSLLQGNPVLIVMRVSTCTPPVSQPTRVNTAKTSQPRTLVHLPGLLQGSRGGSWLYNCSSESNLPGLSECICLTPAPSRLSRLGAVWGGQHHVHCGIRQQAHHGQEDARMACAMFFRRSKRSKWRGVVH